MPVRLDHRDDPVTKAARDADLEWLFFVVSAWQHAQRIAKLNSAQPEQRAASVPPTVNALPPAFAAQWSEVMRRLSPLRLERQKTKDAA